MRYLLIILALLSVAGCGSRDAKPGTQAAKAPEVTTLTVTARDVPVSFEFVAQTQSSRQVNIQARVSGFLEKRVYTEGSLVKEGDVLFQMDAKPFKVQVDAQAAALSRQQAGLEVARADLERTKPLAAQNALSQKDLDDANGQYLATAAAVEEAKARLETAKLNLSYCTILSPVTGISGAAGQQDGTYISPQNSLLTTVAVLSPMWVNFSLSENEMQSFTEQVATGRVRPPADGSYVVEVLLVDGSLFPHKGRITFASPSFNVQTGTFMIRAQRRQSCRCSEAQRLRARPPDRGRPAGRDPAPSAGGAAGLRRGISCGSWITMARLGRGPCRSARGRGTTGSSPRACAPGSR